MHRHGLDVKFWHKGYFCMENSEKVSTRIFEYFLESIFHVRFQILKIDFWNPKNFKNFVLKTSLNSPCKSTQGYKFLFEKLENSSNTLWRVVLVVAKSKISIFGIQKILKTFIKYFFWNLRSISHNYTNFQAESCFIWYFRGSLLIFMKYTKMGWYIWQPLSHWKVSKLVPHNFFQNYFGEKYFMCKHELLKSHKNLLTKLEWSFF